MKQKQVRKIKFEKQMKEVDEIKTKEKIKREECLIIGLLTEGTFELIQGESGRGGGERERGGQRERERERVQGVESCTHFNTLISQTGLCGCQDVRTHQS